MKTKGQILVESFRAAGIICLVDTGDVARQIDEAFAATQQPTDTEAGKPLTLLEFADILEKEKDAFVHENFTCDPETGSWEGSRAHEEWVADQEELIERMRLR